jgi:hypothetical protein
VTKLVCGSRRCAEMTKEVSDSLYVDAASFCGLRIYDAERKASRGRLTWASQGRNRDCALCKRCFRHTYRLSHPRRKKSLGLHCTLAIDSVELHSARLASPATASANRLFLIEANVTLGRYHCECSAVLEQSFESAAISGLTPSP